jgi:hypothetical protein
VDEKQRRTGADGTKTDSDNMQGDIRFSSGSAALLLDQDAIRLQLAGWLPEGDLGVIKSQRVVCGSVAGSAARCSTVRKSSWNLQRTL